jgi:DNA-binding transcriptional ArsR family regulator
MTCNLIIANRIDQKEVQNQDPRQDPSSNLNLYILQQIKLGVRPSKLCKKLGMSKTAFQYHLNKLKHAGLVKKIGYGTWEVTNDDFFTPKRSSKTSQVPPDKTPQICTSFHRNLNFSNCKPDNVRGHAFVFTLKVPKGLKNWNNEKREAFLLSHKVDFISLRIGGGGQRILFKGRKIWLTDRSVIIYDRSSYFAESSSASKSLAIYRLISIIKSLERFLHADFTERAGLQYRFKVSRQHYALVRNVLAKQYDAEDKKLNVYSDRGLWFVIDNSFNLHEAETVHPQTADADNLKVQDFFNSLKEQPLTTGFILEVMYGIQQNQLVFAQNMGSHIKVIKDLGAGVNELTGLIEELKGFRRLDEAQKTLEIVEDK